MKEDNNALIALFLGAEYKQDDYGDFGYFFDRPFIENWHTSFKVEALKFHTSWDWLMPVVEKIEAIQADGINWDYCVTIERDYCVISHHGEDEIVEITADTKLEATHQAVVAFIKHFNSLNKPQ